MVSAAPGRPGWLELRLKGQTQPRVIAKFEPRDGKPAVTHLILVGDNLDPQTLRELPLGRLQSAVHHPKFGFVGERALTEPLPDDVLREMSEREILFPAEFEQIEESLHRYLNKSAEQLQQGMVYSGGGEVAREPLTRPDGSDPDDFSRRLAAAYNALVVTTSKPAKVIAEEAGVPVGTVHRWIREARQRGHLPPAHKGRAG